MRRYIMLAALSVWLCVDAAFAIEPAGTSGPALTLTEAIRTGLDRHPSLDQSRYASQAAQAITKQIKGDRLPWLEASIAESSGSLRIVTTDGRTIHDRGG
ncbi:MAG TPA: hypothetical protein VL329_09115, partial [Nitrospiraceae bacterium]|nr:hypothetical protein [Nitrospiraceae bacterium]